MFCQCRGSRRADVPDFTGRGGVPTPGGETQSCSDDAVLRPDGTARGGSVEPRTPELEARRHPRLRSTDAGCPALCFRGGPLSVGPGTAFANAEPLDGKIADVCSDEGGENRPVGTVGLTGGWARAGRMRSW